MLAVITVAASANTTPVIDSFTAARYQVLPGETITLNLEAHDPDCASICTTGCGQCVRSDMTTWTTSGGSYISLDNGTLGSPYSASAVWQAPSAEGSYTLGVQIFDNGGSLCGGRMSASGTLEILVSNAPPNDPPVIASLTAVPSLIGPLGSSVLTSSVSDPNGDPVTYEWAASAGTITPSGTGTANYTAGPTPGTVVVTLTVRDPGGLSAQKTANISVSLVSYSGSANLGLYSPSKTASSPGTPFYVVDAAAGQMLEVSLPGFTIQDKIPLAGLTAVDVDPAKGILVGTLNGAFLRQTGGGLVTMNAPSGLSAVQDVTVDEAGRRYAVLFREGKVAIFDENGEFLASFGEFGDGAGQFKSPTAVSFDGSGGIWLADNGHGQVHHYDPSGLYLASFGQRGGNSGEFIQLDSIFVDGIGRVWTTDSFKSVVQVFSADGTLLDSFGGYGAGGGLLRTPSGIVVDEAAGLVYVASLNAQSIEKYSMYAPPQPNSPPSAPTASSPQAGSSIFLGSPVILGSLNGVDSDGDELSTEFELYSGAALVSKHSVKNSLSGETTVDVTGDVVAVGDYHFRCRSYDGKDYSPYSADRPFSVITVRPNTPPAAPEPLEPGDGSEVQSLTPILTVLNSTDADGDALAYVFEILKWEGDLKVTVFASPPVQAGEGVTSFPVPAGLLENSQQVFFRASAFDGIDYSAPSALFSFKTPPIEAPSAGQFGDIPSGDRTRPNEVRYSIPPQAGDVTLYYDLYDSGTNEVALFVNGSELATLPAAASGQWSGTMSVILPSGMLSPAQANLLSFVHNAAGDSYGVRNVGLFPVSAPLLAATAFNTVIDLSLSHSVPLDNVSAVRIFRSLSPNDGYEMIAEIPKDKKIFRDTGLTNGSAYYYRSCYLYDPGTEGARSLDVSAVPQAGIVTPVTDLMLTKAGSDVIMTWTAVTNDPPIASIEVYYGAYGGYACDTVNFSNLLATVDPALSSLTLYGKAKEEGCEWYSLIPFDGVAMRGTP